MIKKILFKQQKKTFLEEQQRSVIVSSQKIYFVEDITKPYHCSDGVFKKEDLKLENTTITSNSGKSAFIFNAKFIDSYKGIRKTAQTIPLKDLGYILAEIGITKKDVIVDAGAGSGGCACLLALHCKKVYTYDIEEKNLTQTKENVAYFELKNVVVKKQDIYQKIPNKNVDVIILDVPEPWKALAHVTVALKIGGFLVLYCPQITQTQQTINQLKENMIVQKTVEIVEREWKVEGNIVKPISHANIHSGFITIVRRIN